MVKNNATIAEQESEIEKLKKQAAEGWKMYDNLRKKTVERVATIKPQAVNEFAERLRKKLIDGGLYPVFVKNKIEETKKEMEGDA